MIVGAPLSDPGTSAGAVAEGVGGVVLSGQPPAGAGPAIASALAGLVVTGGAASVPPFLATDEEGGGVARLSGVIGAIPWPAEMARQGTATEVQARMQDLGSKMAALGLTMDLAPVLDTAAPANWIDDEGLRSFSPDPAVAGLYGVAAMRGLRAGGIIPVVKHFPGLGHASADTETVPATDPSLSQLEGADLEPFAQAVDAGAPAVMVGHPVVPGLTGGLPASLSPAAYAYLRGPMGFTGLAMTDDLGMGAVSGAGFGVAGAAEAAVEAGADMVMIVDASQLTSVLDRLAQAVDAGRLLPARVDQALARILALKGLPACPSGSSAGSDPSQVAAGGSDQSQVAAGGSDPSPVTAGRSYPAPITALARPAGPSALGPLRPGARRVASANSAGAARTNDKRYLAIQAIVLLGIATAGVGIEVLRRRGPVGKLARP